MYGFLQTITPGRKRSDKVALFLAALASIGLGIVGSVNEQEDNPVHSGSFNRTLTIADSNVCPCLL